MMALLAELYIKALELEIDGECTIDIYAQIAEVENIINLDGLN